MSLLYFSFRYDKLSIQPNTNLKLKLAHINKVIEAEMSVVIEVMERINKVHVFRPCVIQALVPVVVFVCHAEPSFKAFVRRHASVLVPSQAPRTALCGIHLVVAALGHHLPHRFRSLGLNWMRFGVGIT